jgi:hypothetical protein
MSSVRIVFPKLKLTSQLRAPGGPSVAEAMQAAAANLLELRPECLEELQRLIAEAEDCFGRCPDAFDVGPMRDLYAVASRGVGVGTVGGFAAVDTALVSLCDLLDHLMATERWDRNAVAVHIRALRLLVGDGGRELDPVAETAVLDGLKKVSGRFAKTD